jgi:hypothetical protein
MYYEQNRRHFWTLVLLFRISYSAHWLYYAAYQHENWLRFTIDIGAGFAVPIVLLLTASRIANYTGILVLIGLLLWGFRGSSLT